MSNNQSVLTIVADDPHSILLFAAGRGGSPMRHMPFLKSLAQRGNTIIAPHFDMLKSNVPDKDELDKRIEELWMAYDRFTIEGLPIAGVGHSIGTVALLGLAGAVGQTLSGARVAVAQPKPFSHLALFAPPTEFFRMPNALAKVNSAIKIWVGANDTITPPEQSLFLKSALGDQVHVNIDASAGHFTFMNELPPGVEDTHPDRNQFLEKILDEVSGFICS